MDELFPKLFHPNAPLDDLRALWAVVDVPVPAEGQAINLGEIQSALGVTIAHPLHGAVALPRHIPGIQFHPGRKRWVVLYKSEDRGRLPVIEHPERMLERQQVSADQGLVFLTQFPDATRNPGLTLRFAKDTADFIDVRDMISAHLVTMFKENDESSGLLGAAVPVLSAHWDLVDPTTVRHPPTADGRAIAVKLFGGIDLKVKYDMERHGVNLGKGVLEVWPTIPNEVWTSSWIGGFFRDAPEGTTAMPLVEHRYPMLGGLSAWTFLRPKSSHGATGEMDIRAKATNRRAIVRGRVRAVGIKCSSGEGIFVCDPLPQAELRKKSTTAPRVKVAIDFGTSRSCVVVSDQETSHRLPSFQARAGYASQGRDKGALSFLTPIPTIGGYESMIARGDDDANGPCGLILESALLRRKKMDDTLPLPFIDFSVRPNQLDTDQLTTYDIQSDQGLKWKESKQVERTQYLSCLLLLGLIEVAGRYATDEAEVAYSFPLAFDDAQKAQLKAAMVEAVKSATEMSGFKLTLAEPVSESLAGLSSLDGAGGDWVLTVDVGGGTTDFGLWTDVSSTMPTALAADSVEFAGDLLLEAAGLVAGTPDRAKLAIQSNVFLSKNLRDVKTSDQNVHALYLSTVTQWQNWLVEYAARLVAGTVIREAERDTVVGDEIAIRSVILGGGWNALDALTKGQAERSFSTDETAQAKVNALLSDRVEWLLAKARSGGRKLPRVRFSQLGVGILQAQREKFAIAQGIVKAQKYEKAFGISAPNGLEEHRRGVQEVDWHVAAGNGDWSKSVFMKDPDIVASPVVPGAEAILADLAIRDSTLSNELRAAVNRATSGTGTQTYRSRTALAIVFKQLLAPQIERRPKSLA